MDVVFLVAGLAVVVVFSIVAVLFARMRRADLTSPPVPGEKPPWLSTTPPPETVAATQADGEHGALWDYDAGERVAAPFAEQIEDVVAARIAADPELRGIEFDMGTSEDGSLQFWVQGSMYTSIAELPDPRLRRVVQEAVEYWEGLGG